MKEGFAPCSPLGTGITPCHYRDVPPDEGEMGMGSLFVSPHQGDLQGVISLSFCKRAGE